MAEESPIEGLAYLPSLTERELRVLLAAVESRQRLPIGDESATGRILWSLHTAISEAIYAAQRETKRLREEITAEVYDETRYTPEVREIIEQEVARRQAHQSLDLDEQDGCPND